MTFTLILILNIALDATILGLLAFVMFRPAKLRPHRVVQVPRQHAPEQPRRQRALSGLRPLLD